MNRRGFLGALAATAFAIAFSPRIRAIFAPRLWGDGIHDDTAALQWYIDHAKPIPSGHYHLTQTLHVWQDRGGRIVAENSYFEASGDADPTIHVHGPFDGIFNNNTLRLS